MRGPKLSTPEIVALLTRQIAQLTELGVGHDRALTEVAGRHGVDPTAVARLVASPQASDRLPTSTSIAA